MRSDVTRYDHLITDVAGGVHTIAALLSRAGTVEFAVVLESNSNGGNAATPPPVAMANVVVVRRDERIFIEAVDEGELGCVRGE